MAFGAIRMNEGTKRHSKKRGPGTRQCETSKSRGQVKEKGCVGVAEGLRGNPGAYRTLEPTHGQRGQLGKQIP